MSHYQLSVPTFFILCIALPLVLFIKFLLNIPRFVQGLPPFTLYSNFYRGGVIVYHTTPTWDEDSFSPNPASRLLILFPILATRTHPDEIA
jgi:hypothetical protein